MTLKSLPTRPLRLASFGTLGLIAVILMVATAIEKVCGTEAVVTHIYTSWWMIALWGLTALSGIIYLCRCEKRITTIALHAAFLLILAGALTTHLTGIEGKIHLREKMPPSKEYYTSEGKTHQLPFALSLDDFTTVYYPNTSIPMDYVSQLTITERDGTTTPAITSRALVTMLIYAAPLHSRSLSSLTRPMTLHRYCIAAFLCVIATYFGVNFLLGGMHSYAG